MNQLAGETSPYLLQHKDNPVAWRPWGDDAFAAARAEGKPILLSVGYAACHWCHVMAHESFERDDTAALMNDLFVNVKVDREERPDVDALYQSALAMLGQHGGWPLTMFLTPDGAPFWGGTYFPPESRWGRPGFRDVLKGVAQAWRDRPNEVRANVDALRRALEEQSKAPPAEHLEPGLLDQAARGLLGALDPVHGGVAGAPKFPQPTLMTFLWRTGLASGDRAITDAVRLALDHMCQGGIYDHLGGGFARYSTDETWLVPHFEKMLYDNALLIGLLTEAWRATRSPLYARRVAETVGWLEREMIAECGTFAATLDADSEGEEGRFYVWDAAEVDALLPPDQAAAVKRVYGISAAGNWEGKNILHRNHRFGGDSQDLSASLAVLHQAREARIRPERDDKVLADWNALMIAALAEAALTFDRPDWLALAGRAYDGVRMLLGDGDRLSHATRAGKRRDAAVLDDYAAMARAAVALHEATGEAAPLDQARRWVAAADTRFWDDAAGGYFFDAGELLVRTKTAFDTATPAGNGVMADVLVRLWLLTGEQIYRTRADALFEAFSGLVRGHFASLGSLLNAFALRLAPLKISVGSPDLLRAAAQAPVPHRVLHRAAGGGAMVCRGETCLPPVATADELRACLGAR